MALPLQVRNHAGNNISFGVDDEARIELLLSERLMEGYVLLEKSCPVCSTPLVKRSGFDDEDDEGMEQVLEPIMVPSGSFDQPFKPVEGVPFCVGCSSHVITQECEISILERCDSLKAKGSILVALQDTSFDVSGSQYTTPSAQQQQQQQQQQEKKVVVDPSGTSTKDAISQHSHVIDLTEVREKNTIAETTAQQSIQKEVVTSFSSKHSGEVPQTVYSDEKKEEDPSAYDDDKKEEDHSSFENQNADEIMAEYSVRREIATKVLGAKMLQGYTLKETQCGKCGMPQMEYQGKLDCVVCPALMKKAKKQLKAQKKMEQGTVRLEREIDAAKAKLAAASALVEQRRQEAEVAREKARRQQEARAEQQQREMKEEKLRLQDLMEEEKGRIAGLEAEEARLLADARTRAKEDTRMQKQSRLAGESTQKDMDQFHRENAHATLTEEFEAAAEKRRREDLKLLEETKRLEAMEERRRLALSSAAENMQQDLLSQEHQKRLAGKARLDEDILRLEQGRLVEELETRLFLEQQRAEEEAKMIETLEEEAASKAKMARMAILKAKSALEHVSSARRDIIAQTIAMAEAEAVQEAENIIKSEREDYRAPVLLQSASDVQKERWETLRTEGRSVMTRRVMAGWTLVSEFCLGTECENSPLIIKYNKKECVVCGGCGDGTDGAYTTQSVDSGDLFGADLMNLHCAEVDSIQEARYTPTASIPAYTLTVKELQDDFETKRDMVSKEIGKRMIQGWTLLDASCPHCVMPLMMDNKGRTDICVLCGLIENIQNNDGHTIKPIVNVPSAEETVPISTRADATTIGSTLPSIMGKSANLVSGRSYEEVETTLPSAPTMEDLRSLEPSAPSMEEKEQTMKDQRPKLELLEHLADTIRQQAIKRAPLISPMGDPPASLKQLHRKSGPDPDDFKEKSVLNKTSYIEKKREVQVSSKTSSVDHQDNVSRMTGRNDFDVPSSADEIAKMFLQSPMGYEALQKGEQFCNIDEVKDLVDFFVATSLKQTLSDETKKEIASEIIKTVKKSSVTSPKKISTSKSQDIINLAAWTPHSNEVIHLEDYPSPEPKAFNFNIVEKEEVSVAPSVSSKKQRPTPESMIPKMARGRARSDGQKSVHSQYTANRNKMPPRPDAGPRSRLPRPSPRTQVTPRNAGFLVVGSPSEFDHHNDNRSVAFDEVSRACTVASQTMDSILSRIEDCKEKLMDPNSDVETQLESANLIERLAKAAVAVKKLEDLDF